MHDVNLVKEDIHRLDNRIDRVEEKLEAKIDKLDGKVDKLAEDVTEMKGLLGEMKGQMDGFLKGSSTRLSSDAGITGLIVAVGVVFGPVVIRSDQGGVM